jgi:hypothetical protein
VTGWEWTEIKDLPSWLWVHFVQKVCSSRRECNSFSTNVIVITLKWTALMQRISELDSCI